MYQTFEDLIAWQKAWVLVKDVYQTFQNLKDWSFKDQIQRASISIMNNIAEGFERKGLKEFDHFLSMAKGSCGEVRSMLLVAKDLGYIYKKDSQKLYNLALEISKILASLRKSL